eukprot:PLAT7045.1.p1 GENE.PLAT7045.1~~PLAT7045.1.p1  ORF type:complete len:662 (+),score=284.46 PLAT7045.1:296-1987(+)
MVLEFGWPDHHSPPLATLYKACHSIKSWLDADPANVAVVHCMAGKGRTGVCISAYLVFCGHFPHLSEPQLAADAALTFFARQRSSKSNGVSYPSQQRYVHYFARMLLSAAPPERPLSDVPLITPRPLYLSHVIMLGVPAFDSSTGGCKPYLHVLTAAGLREKSRLLHSTAWNAPRLTALRPEDAAIQFDIGIPVCGDVYFRCYHSGRRQTLMFRLAVHTSFVEGQMAIAADGSGGGGGSSGGSSGSSSGEEEGKRADSFVLRLQRDEVDLAHKRQEFPADFALDLCFSPSPDLAGRSAPAGRRGYLMKEGGFVRSWKRRWFVLTAETLSYYEDEGEGKPLGVIPLAGGSVDFDREKRPNCFALYSPAKSRTYIIEAATEEERWSWMQSLRTAVGGEPLRPRARSEPGSAPAAVAMERSVSTAAAGGGSSTPLTCDRWVSVDLGEELLNPLMLVKLYELRRQLAKSGRLKELAALSPIELLPSLLPLIVDDEELILAVQSFPDRVAGILSEPEEAGLLIAPAKQVAKAEEEEEEEEVEYEIVEYEEEYEVEVEVEVEVDDDDYD